MQKKNLSHLQEWSCEQSSVFTSCWMFSFLCCQNSQHPSLKSDHIRTDTKQLFIIYFICFSDGQKVIPPHSCCWNAVVSEPARTRKTTTTPGKKTCSICTCKLWAIRKMGEACSVPAPFSGVSASSSPASFTPANQNQSGSTLLCGSKHQQPGCWVLESWWLSWQALL